MRSFIAIVVLSLSLSAGAQMQKPPAKPWTLKTILLEQLRSTHNTKDWFVDANTAVATPSANSPITWCSGTSAS